MTSSMVTCNNNFVISTKIYSDIHSVQKLAVCRVKRSAFEWYSVHVKLAIWTDIFSDVQLDK